ncbi:glycosyltransferase family 39 protein [Candidatus Woesearchaeota archaeon]|nr:glycosyltransferase family 39 protein [Candidatus Woesearchaeota archaeon]
MKRETIYDILVLVLFLISFFIRINVDKIYLNNPGNVKASDPAYHVLVADYIAESGVIGKSPPYLAQGHTNVVDIVPPLQAIISGSLIHFSGIESWNITYFVPCLLNSLALVIIYLMFSRIFRSKEIGIMAMALLVVPFNARRWWYFLFIGVWPNISVLTYVVFNIYLMFLFFETKEKIYLYLLGASLSALYLLHYSEIILLLPLLIYLLYCVLRNDSLVQKIINFAAIGFLPFIMFVLTITWLIFSREGSLPSGIQVHIPQYTNFPFAVTVQDIGIVYGLIFFIGFILLLTNYKKYKNLIFYYFYFYTLTFILPFLVKGEYYLLRLRPFTIYLIAPMAAYALYYLIVKPLQKAGIPSQVSAVILGFLFVIAAVPGYKQLQSGVDYINIPEIRYQAYDWINENTAKEDVVFSFGDDSQNIDCFMKRVKYRVYLQPLRNIGLNENESLPLMYEGYWVQFFWHQGDYLKNIFSVARVTPRAIPNSLLEFDYVYFEHIDQQIAQFNVKLAKQLIEDNGFSVVFNNNFAIVLKNENQQ